MSRRFRITLPLEVEQEFDEDIFDVDDPAAVKEALGELLDMLLISTDYLWDYWKDAQVEEITNA
jgi:hypothetical protein